MSYRFVLPVLPIALMFSGYALAKMKAPDSPDTEKEGSLRSHIKGPYKMRFSILFLLATNIPMALYMSLVHQVHCFPPVNTKAGYFLRSPLPKCNSFICHKPLLCSYNVRWRGDKEDFFVFVSFIFYKFS